MTFLLSFFPLRTIRTSYDYSIVMLFLVLPCKLYYDMNDISFGFPVRDDNWPCPAPNPIGQIFVEFWGTERVSGEIRKTRSESSRVHFDIILPRLSALKCFYI